MYGLILPMQQSGRRKASLSVSSPPDHLQNPPESSERGGADTSQRNLPLPKHKHTHIFPLLAEEEAAELASKFAEQIPENEFSVRCRIPTKLVRYPNVLCRWLLCRDTCLKIRPGRMSV